MSIYTTPCDSHFFDFDDLPQIVSFQLIMIRLSIIWLGSYLAIILFCNSCDADLASLASNPQLDTEHPMKPCGKALAEGNLQGCVSAFFSKYKAHEDWSKAKSVTICKNKCTVKRKGRFLGWEWVWDAIVGCGSKAPRVVGEATKKSRTGSLHWAAKDFYSKAQSIAQFSAEETNCWKERK